MAAQVIFCIVKPHPDAYKAFIRYAPAGQVIDVSADDYAYWNAIRQRWTGERDLIIVEQDIEIGPGTVAAMQRCGQDWCCYAYPVFGMHVQLRAGLGCTKISAGAQRKVPAALVEEEAFTPCDSCRGKGCWWHLDGRVAWMLGREGFSPHVHGDVIHHHSYGNIIEETADVRLYDDPAGTVVHSEFGCHEEHVHH